MTWAMKTTPTTDFTKKVTQLYQLKQRAGAWTSEISGNIPTHEGLSLNFGQWQNMIWKSTSNTLFTSTVITCQLSENHQNEQGMHVRDVIRTVLNLTVTIYENVSYINGWSWKWIFHHFLRGEWFGNWWRINSL